MLPFYVTKLGTIDLSSTSAEKCFFGDLAMWKLNFSLDLSIDLNFRHTSKKIKRGSPKKILKKKNVFPKKYVEFTTFDGIRKKYFKSICNKYGYHIPQLQFFVGYSSSINKFPDLPDNKFGKYFIKLPESLRSMSTVQYLREFYTPY